MGTVFSTNDNSVSIFEEQVVLTRNTKLISINNFKATSEQRVKDAVRKNIVRLLVVECHADTSIL